MNGPWIQFAYLAVAAGYMLVVATRRTQDRSAAWKFGAVVAWIALFAGLAFVAEGFGWRVR